MDTFTQRRWGFRIFVVVTAMLLYGWYRNTQEDQHTIRNTFRIAGDVRVTTYDGGDTMPLSLALGGRVWKFDVEPTQPSCLWISMELRVRGKKPVIVGTIGPYPEGNNGWGSTKPYHLQCGIVPLGNDVFNAAQVKVFLAGAGGAMESIVDNPFKGVSIMSFPSQQPPFDNLEPQTYNNLMLMNVSDRNGTVTWNTYQDSCTLALHIERTAPTTGKLFLPPKR